MAKYRKIMPEIEAISMVEVLYGFKHNFNALPQWIQEAYNRLVISNIQEDCMYIDTINGLVIANEEDYLLYENECIKVKKGEIFEAHYERVVE